MKNFFSALSFLTVIPVPGQVPSREGRAVLYFPVVGLVIGISLCMVDYLCSLFLSVELRAVADALFLAIITGGLHLDGLADTADGLFSHRSRERALEIMRDPQIGSMGAIAIVFAVLLKTGGLAGLQGHDDWVWLLVTPALARVGLVAGLVFMDYARPEGGLAVCFFQKGNYFLVLLCPIPLAIPFYFGMAAGLFVLGICAVVLIALLIFFKRKLNGMTGDTLGATCEILEITALIAAGLTQHLAINF